jgi:hypothetical protein
MFNKIKSLMSESAVSLADNADNFNNTLRLQQLYQNYGALSNNRFANNRDYQKQLQCMSVSYGGLNRVMTLLARFNPASK